MFAVALLAAFFCVTEQVSAQVKEYKLNESFDALTSGVPAGWNVSQGTSSNSYRWQSHAQGYNNTRGLRFDSYNNSSGNTSILLTPTLDLTLGEWVLTFRYKNPTGGPFSVYVSTDGGTTYLNNAVGQNLPNTNDWVQMTYSITALAAHSANVKIAFRGESNYADGDAYIYLDDVTVESAPTCKSPEAIMAMGVTQTGATIFWNLSQDGAIPASYYITVTDGAGNTVINNQSITAPNLSYTLTGLTAGTTYNVQLQGDCSAAFQGSSTSTGFTFSTLCQPQNAPFADNFDAATAMPGCTYTKNA